MKDEIKEILDKLSNRKQETLIQGLRECQLKDIEHPFITREEYIDKILDYITYLQEECRSNGDIIHNLQEENERLKEENKHIFANVNDDLLLRSNAMNYAEAQDYKTRIDKAIEYIKKHCDYGYAGQKCLTDVLYRYEAEELLEILQGKSDE